MDEMRFFADSMLGKLARWLRLMGMDVEYATPDLKDEEIMLYCRENNLVLVTRDRELSTRQKNSIYIASDNHVEQLREFVKLHRPSPEKYFSRCPLCNGRVSQMSTAEYSGDLPEGVRMRQKTVYVCQGCGKVYWEGSHFDSILNKINEINGSFPG